MASTTFSLPARRFRRLYACFLLLLVCVTGLVSAPARADDWRVDFGPYLGAYDFDALTAFEDRALFGARLGVHRGGAFRFEMEFDEVYTRRIPLQNAARQATLAAHLRFEPPQWRLSPSVLAGAAMVLFDDSEQPDGFSEAYDAGAGLAWRLSDSWRLRGEFVLRYQRFQIRDPELPADDPASRSGPTDLWARAVRVGAFYEFPAERDGEAASYPVEFGVFAGYWDFDPVFRYEDDAVFGLRTTIGLARWFAVQVEIDQITTSNRATNDWARAYGFALHGLVDRQVGERWRPGLLAGVAFQGLDNRQDFDAITEGFDVGPAVRFAAAGRMSLQAEALLRYQSVRLNLVAEDGVFIGRGPVDYVWSWGLRLGMNVEL